VAIHELPPHFLCHTQLKTAISRHKKKIESAAKQHFQFFSWFGFERKAL